MGRIAATEDVEGIRDEHDVKDPAPEAKENEEAAGEHASQSKSPSPPPPASLNAKYIATVIEVQDAFDSLNTLRYSQPTHLQGELFPLEYISKSPTPTSRKMPGPNNHTIQRWT